MTNKKDFQNNCFSPNWLEVDLTEARTAQTSREERLESKRRKDLNTLLKELEEIKQNIEKAAEKGLEFRIKTVDAPIVEISSSEIIKKLRLAVAADKEPVDCYNSPLPAAYRELLNELK